MNAALLLMSSTLGAGPEIIQVGWGENPPKVVQASGCSNCGSVPVAAAAPCDPCATASRTSFLDKLKAKFAKPAPACDPCATASYSQPNLLDKIKAKLASKKSAPCTSCGSAPVAGCATPLPAGATPVTPVTPADPPKEMPKPKDTKPVDPKPADPKPKGTGTGLQSIPQAPATAPSPVSLPPIPSAPPAVTTPTGSGNSPY